MTHNDSNDSNLQWTFSIDFFIGLFNGPLHWTSSQSCQSSMTSISRMDFLDRLFCWTFLLDFLVGLFCWTLLLDFFVGLFCWTLLLDFIIVFYCWTLLLDFIVGLCCWTLLLDFIVGLYWWTLLMDFLDCFNFNKTHVTNTHAMLLEMLSHLKR